MLPQRPSAPALIGHSYNTPAGLPNFFSARKNLSSKKPPLPCEKNISSKINPDRGSGFHGRVPFLQGFVEGAG
jgi:hypothetical protein